MIFETHPEIRNNAGFAIVFALAIIGPRLAIIRKTNAETN